MIKPLQSLTLKNNDGEDTTYVVASAPAIVETTEPASVASFADGAAGIPVESLIADINPVQTGSGDPSPSNVRSITGWTGMNVVRTGKNILDPSKMTENVSTRKRWYWTDGFVLKANKTYTLSVTGQDGATAYIYAMDGTTLSSGIPSATYTPTADTTVRFQVYRQAGIADSATYQLEVGSTATTYEPYNGTTYPISWADEAGTVYGGTLDVTTGLLTVDKASLTITSFSYVVKENNGFRSYDPCLPAMSVAYGEVASNMFVRATSYSEATGGVKNAIGYNAAGQLLFNVYQNGAYITTTDDLGTFVASNPIQIVYPLATPQTYQLTPQAVLTILGQNNIWADTGDVEVAYCADTKMYIDKVIAAL